MTENPYIGPMPFTKNDQLYGRDGEANELMKLILAERIVLMYSPSGAGKTSLIQAKLLHRLPVEQFFPLPVLRVGSHDASGNGQISSHRRLVHHTLISLNQHLPNPLRFDEARLAKMTLAEFLESYLLTVGAPADRIEGQEAVTLDPILIFDQFEEILVGASVDEASVETFFKELSAILSIGGNQGENQKRIFYALIAMREDYVAHLEPFKHLIPGSLRACFRLDLLTRRQALDAIVLPAKARGVSFTETAALELLERLSPPKTENSVSSSHIDPVQLQVVCRSLWDALPEDEREIGSSRIPTTGEVDQALSKYYEDTVGKTSSALEVNELSIREWFERDLISGDGFRTQVSHGPFRLAKKDGDTVKHLVDAYLVRTDTRLGTVWYELSHDRMILPIKINNKVWRLNHLSKFQVAADVWAREGKPPYLLLRGREFREAEQLAKKQLSLSPDERKFLEECNRLRRRAKRRFLFAIASVGFTAIITFAIYALNEGARDERVSRARELAMAALYSATSTDADPERALLLALQSTREEAAPKQSSVSTPGSRWWGFSWRRSDGHISEAAVAALNWTMQSSPRHSLVEVGEPISSLGFTTNGEQLIIKTRSGQIRSFDPILESLVTLSQGQERSGTGIIGQTLAITETVTATAGESNQIDLWVPRNGAMTKLSPKTFPERVDAIALSSDGRFLAAGGATMVGLWDLSRNSPMPQRLTSQPSSIVSIAFVAQGKRLVAITNSGIEEWKVEDGVKLLDSPSLLGGSQAEKTVGSARPSHQMLNAAIAETPDHVCVAVADGDRIEVGKPRTGGGEYREILSPGGIISRVALSPDGNTLAAAGDGGSIWIWALDVQDGSHCGPVLRRETTLRAPTEKLYSLTFSPDGERLASGGSNGIVRIWDIQAPTRFEASDSRLSADGSLVAQTFDPGLVIWNTGKVGLQSLLRYPFCQQAAFSGDGHRLAGVSNRDLRVWNPYTGSVIKVIPEGKYAFGVSMNGDGTLVAAYGVKGVGVWNVDTGRARVEMTQTRDPVQSIALSSDGQWLAYGGLGDAIFVVDLRNPDKDPLKIFIAAPVTALAFGPDNGDVLPSRSPSPHSALLAVGMNDGKVNIYRIDFDSLANRFIALGGKSKGVTSIAFSPNGEEMVVASAEGSWVYHLLSKKDEPLEIAGQAVRSATFSSDGKDVVTVADDGSIQDFIVDPQKLTEAALSRITRPLSQIECRRYLHVETCPSEVTNVEHYLEGERFSRSGAKDKAVEAFSSAKGVDPFLPTDVNRKFVQLRAEALMSKAQFILNEITYQMPIDLNKAHGEDTKRMQELFSVLEEARNMRAFSPAKASDEAHELLQTAETLVEAGDLDDAERLFREAETIDNKVFTAEPKAAALFHNSLCWYGTLWGHASQVIQYCDTALQEFPSSVNIKDSRGLARACTGDSKGAIADLSQFTEQSSDPQDQSQRNGWIAILQTPSNLCTAKFLRNLRQQYESQR